jgi:hypothetical protein
MKHFEWLDSLPVDEKEKLLTDGIKDGKEIRVKYKKRLLEIESRRKAKLKEKQNLLQEKQKAILKRKSKHTNDILHYGLWQKPEEIDNVLDELETITEKRRALTAQIRFRQRVLKQTVQDKKLYNVSEKGKLCSIEKLKNNVLMLIKDAAEGPCEEKPLNTNQPLLVGKKVCHSFDDRKWIGRVISVVKGFPKFYNIVYDQDIKDSSAPAAIYTYKLQEDYKAGCLQIIPEVVSHIISVPTYISYFC